MQNKEPKELYDFIFFLFCLISCAVFPWLTTIHCELTLIWITLKYQSYFHVKMYIVHSSNKSAH